MLKTHLGHKSLIFFCNRAQKNVLLHDVKFFLNALNITAQTMSMLQVEPILFEFNITFLILESLISANN